MSRGNVEKLPVYFVKNYHCWIDITGSLGYVKVECADCGLKTMQDGGSLLYYVVEGDSVLASLTCEEIQIKKIIE